MLLWISKVVRHRSCSRPLERHAACVALGDGTDTEVAVPCQYVQMSSLGSVILPLYCDDISASSIVFEWNWWFGGDATMLVNKL
jgi:hypothetical protein